MGKVKRETRIGLPQLRPHEEMRISQSLTTDEHFRKAGFEPAAGGLISAKEALPKLAIGMTING
jgi:hypothetical protein